MTAERTAKIAFAGPNRFVDRDAHARKAGDHEEGAVRLCRCSEPVKYVSQIQSRYESYAKLVPLQ